MKKTNKNLIDDLSGFTDICESEKGMYHLVGTGCAEESWASDACYESLKDQEKGKSNAYETFYKGIQQSGSPKFS